MTASETAHAWTEALALLPVLHEPGQRERYRGLLERAIDHASSMLACVEPERLREVQVTLARAHAAKAEDARHGAGQLSLSAQRAPTFGACEDGWRRVEAIVLGAETSAAIAAQTAGELERDASGTAAARAARAAASKAGAAAQAARRIVLERNDAYSFHADSRFSFGEGWYLAAAGVLAGVSIQIEPDRDQSLQAERFLRDAGLGARLRPYRSRPRAMKHVTELIAQAFRRDPRAAARALRTAFLGGDPAASAVTAWIEERFARAPTASRAAKKVLLWVRQAVHHVHRNTPHAELVELARRAHAAGLVPVLIGDALREGPPPEGALDLVLFWQDPVFQQLDMRRAQLQCFEVLRARHGLVGQLGVTTAGMDGPALLGLPTLYLTDAPNVRMGQWVGALPGYEEVVRESDYLERISRRLRHWASASESYT
ncbi:MAG TPA: hypothetical protein VGQ57_15685 [Polyangiaceae bacterium]|nr:hypothetical protein [Polyangiaceae bacterium]